MLPDRLNALRRLKYQDPALVLKHLREAELAIGEWSASSGIQLDPKSLALRTGKLKQEREWRDAALFTYGMGLLCGVKMGFATSEDADYDIVTAWKHEDTTAFCPVQLKELPPADLNPKATLSQLFASLKKYAGQTDTTLAVKLSRRPEVPLESFRAPDAPFKEVYLYWATAPHSAKWILYGNLKVEAEIVAFEYDYPT